MSLTGFIEENAYTLSEAVVNVEKDRDKYHKALCDIRNLESSLSTSTAKWNKTLSIIEELLSVKVLK